jgi:hypothetical protein
VLLHYRQACLAIRSDLYSAVCREKRAGNLVISDIYRRKHCGI